MAISEHLEKFAGFTVRDFDPDVGIRDTVTTIYRVAHDPETAPTHSHKPPGLIGKLFGKQSPPPAPSPKADPFAALLADPKASQLQGIVYGYWLDDYDTSVSSAALVAKLAAAGGKLPNLSILFIGDVTYEEVEISWITQSDVTPLFRAYPGLEHFGVRGSNELRIGPVQHSRLKSLVLQCGGLPTTVLNEVLQSELPALEHLELWLGDGNYGADITSDALEPLLSGKLFPRLRYLALRDSEISDDVAAAVAKAPILQRIRILDLSLGNLSDKGAEALLASPAIAALEKLDLHHHYMSDEVLARFTALGPDVDTSEQKKADKDGDDVYRYIAVSE
jgi:hypothetical protein